MPKRLSKNRKDQLRRNLRKARAALAAKRSGNGILLLKNDISEPTYVMQLEATLQQRDEEAKVLNGIIEWLYKKL